MQPKVRSAPNFRDFGGLPTQDGRRIRRGWLFRSDALDTLEDDDHAVLNPLRIGLICDLRSVRERHESPSLLPPEWTPDVLTVDEAIDVGAANVGRAFRRELYTSDGRAREFMAETYRAFPRQFEALLRDLFARLVAGQGPVLVHCAAGKDRTGFVCAMVQHVLGVAPDRIMADYLLSDEFFGIDRIAEAVRRHTGLTVSSSLMDPMRVKAEYLDVTMEAIEATHGSIDDYLRAQAGVTKDLREALRDRLLEHGAD